MKWKNADSNSIRCILSAAFLAAQLGCANTKPVKLYYIQQDPKDIHIEQPNEGISQKRFDQKIAEIKVKAKDNPAILNAVDSLFNDQAKYCYKRNGVEFFTAGLLFSASLFGHYLWCRSIRNKYKDVTEQGGMAALGDGMIWTASFAATLPLEFFVFPKLASRALVGPRVKPDNEKALRKLIMLHNGKDFSTQDSVKIK